MAKQSKIAKWRRTTEIDGTGPHEASREISESLLPMRSAPRLHPQVRALSHLFSRSRVAGLIAWCHKVKLVVRTREISDYDHDRSHCR